MSWFFEKKVVPYVPVTCVLPGNIQLIIACTGDWIYTSLDCTWNDFFIHQQNNHSGVEWTDEEYARRQGAFSKYKTFKVPSSKGNKDYTIVVNGNYVSCNCTGFGFRKYCRHVKEIKDKLIEEGIL